MKNFLFVVVMFLLLKNANSQEPTPVMKIDSLEKVGFFTDSLVHKFDVKLQFPQKAVFSSEEQPYSDYMTTFADDGVHNYVFSKHPTYKSAYASGVFMSKFKGITYDDFRNNRMGGMELLSQNDNIGRIRFGSPIINSGQYVGVKPQFDIVLKADENQPNFTSHFATKLMFNNIAPGLEMVIRGNGSVGIGTEEVGNYKLAVNGVIGAEDMVIDVTSWPDYVFEEDYKLMEIKKLREFILENGHLPNVPSANEITEISVSTSNQILLEKIEELTLYIIQLDEKISILEKELQEN